jgi:hypothetical protein
VKITSPVFILLSPWSSFTVLLFRICFVMSWKCVEGERWSKPYDEAVLFGRYAEENYIFAFPLVTIFIHYRDIGDAVYFLFFPRLQVA